MSFFRAAVLANIIVLMLPSSISAAGMSDAERAAAVAYLEETRDGFVKLVEEVDDEQFRYRPSPDEWSIAQIAEHLLKVEGVVLDGLTSRLLVSPPRPELRSEGGPLIRDHVVRMAVTNRDAKKFDAPGLVRPGEDAMSRSEAVAAFVAARSRTIELARTTSADLRVRFMENPALGLLDGYQWLLFVGAHTERHTAQAREVTEGVRFPGRLRPIGADERAALVVELARNRDRIDRLAGNLTETQFRYKPAANRWSIHEVIEHLAKAETLLLSLVREMVATGTPEPGLKGDRGPRVKDLAFVMAITNREAKRFEAPAPLKPASEFATSAEALATFRARRETTIEYARGVQDDLRAYFRENPGFGSMDGYQWLLLMSAHGDRHAQQIEEIRTGEGFPE